MTKCIQTNCSEWNDELEPLPNQPSCSESVFALKVDDTKMPEVIRLINAVIKTARGRKESSGGEYLQETGLEKKSYWRHWYFYMASYPRILAKLCKMFDIRFVAYSDFDPQSGWRWLHKSKYNNKIRYSKNKPDWITKEIVDAL